jgi:hypothetical protein
MNQRTLTCRALLLSYFLLPLLEAFTPSSLVATARTASKFPAKYSDDLDDDDDDAPPEVDVKNFKPPKTTASFGFNRGRSSPTTRKAMGVSGKSSAKGERL